MIVKFSYLLSHYRERVHLTKSQLASRIGVTNNYIFGIEKGRVKPPTEERLIQICRVLNLTKDEESKLLQLALEERVTDKLSPGFRELLESNGHKVLKDETPRVAPTLPWQALFNLKTKEGDMIRVQWGGPDVYEFKTGDILVIQITKKIKEGFYVLKDIKNRKIVLNMMEINTTTNLEIIGRVVERITKY